MDDSAESELFLHCHSRREEAAGECNVFFLFLVFKAVLNHGGGW